MILSHFKRSKTLNNLYKYKEKYFSGTTFTGFILILLLSCCQETENNKTQHVQAFPFEDTPKAQRILNPDWNIEFLNPVSIINLNDRYLILNYFRPDDFFHVFKLPEVNYLYSWGKKGRGPDEFTQNPVYINSNKDELIVFDGILQSLRYLSVNDTTLIKSRELALSYEGQVEPLNRIRRIHDTLYVVIYGSSIQEETNHEHMALQPGEESPLFTFGEYPNTNLEGFDRYSEFLKTNTAKPDGSRFAAFYIAQYMFKINTLVAI